MVTRWSALVAAVALFVGLGLLGDTPDTRDSSGQIASYFVAHSTSVLAAAVLLGVAVAALLVFAASLGNRVSQSAATVVATVMLTALVLPYVALAYVVGAEASDAAKPIFEITLAATPVLALPLALLVASTGLAAVRRAPSVRRREPGARRAHGRLVRLVRGQRILLPGRPAAGRLPGLPGVARRGGRRPSLAP